MASSGLLVFCLLRDILMNHSLYLCTSVNRLRESYNLPIARRCASSQSHFHSIQHDSLPHSRPEGSKLIVIPKSSCGDRLSKKAKTKTIIIIEKSRSDNGRRRLDVGEVAVDESQGS